MMLEAGVYSKRKWYKLVNMKHDSNLIEIQS